MDIPPEVATSVGTGLAVLGSKDVLNKLLGPTAEYLGDKVKGLVSKADINLDGIFVRMTRILGPRIDTNERVNPRVLKNVIDDGAFTEDPIAQEYYAGVLAASRTPDGFDDRGVHIAGIFRGMSVYQLRLHYVFYAEVLRLLSATREGCTLALDTDREISRMFIPMDVCKAVIVPETQWDQAETLLAHAATGLAGRLFGHAWLISDTSFGGMWPDAPLGADGAVFEPALLGMEVFYWGLGRRDIRPGVVKDARPENHIISIPKGCALCTPAAQPRPRPW